jgi:hypothetical protein
VTVADERSPVARLPGSAPSKIDLDERDRFAKVAAGSADAVRASAQAWRTGLTAFITLVTTGVVIQGRNSTASLPVSWRAAAIAAVGSGLALAILGLWQALAAEAGTRPRKETLQEIRASYGSLTTYQAHLADAAAVRLKWGIRAATAAIAALFAGIVITWVAPTAPVPQQALVVVHGGAVICGTLASAPPGQFRLVVSDRATVTIPISELTSVTAVGACP